MNMLANRKNFTNNGNKVNLAERIKEIRKAKGMSQEKLAEKLVVKRNTVANWEQEVCMPSVDNIIAIADVAEISLDELVGRTNQLKEGLPKREDVNMLIGLGEKIQELIQSEIDRIQKNAQ